MAVEFHCTNCGTRSFLNKADEVDNFIKEHKKCLPNAPASTCPDCHPDIYCGWSWCPNRPYTED